MALALGISGFHSMLLRALETMMLNVRCFVVEDDIFMVLQSLFVACTVIVVVGAGTVDY